MKAILFHCKKYKTKINSLSTRPESVEPEEVEKKARESEKCIVAFISVEKGDNIKNAVACLAPEIIEFCRNVKAKNVVITPFAHLTNNLISSKQAKMFFDLLENSLKNKFNVVREHFGSHKELFLNVYGHPGSVRYREC